MGRIDFVVGVIVVIVVGIINATSNGRRGSIEEALLADGR